MQIHQLWNFTHTELIEVDWCDGGEMASGVFAVFCGEFW